MQAAELKVTAMLPARYGVLLGLHRNFLARRSCCFSPARALSVRVPPLRSETCVLVLVEEEEPQSQPSHGRDADGRHQPIDRQQESAAEAADCPGFGDNDRVALCVQRDVVTAEQSL